MTESEAIGFVQGKLDCMNKCDIFNKEDKHSDNDCDNCEYCYSQGNFGNQKEAFQMAINALEKQIPKKPIINHINTNEDVTEIEYTCSACGTNYVELTPCEEFCPYCGNKIDWSDEE